MADKKITQMTALAEAASGDLLHIVDIDVADAEKNKKITSANLAKPLVKDSGNIGIGITPSKGKLHVKQTGDTHEHGITVEGTGGGTVKIYHDNSNKGIIQKGANANQLVLDDSGNIGIGTNAPDRMVHVKGANANLHLEREDPSAASFFFSNVNGVNTTHWKMEAQNNAAGAGKGCFNIADDGTASGGAATIRLKIDETGKMGIGTGSPKSKLHVVGLAEYADNAAAVAGGLTVGAFYRTGDLLKVVH